MRQTLQHVSGKTWVGGLNKKNRVFSQSQVKQVSLAKDRLKFFPQAISLIPETQRHGLHPLDPGSLSLNY